MTQTPKSGMLISMSDLIADLLARFPTCRVTINSRPPRKKSQTGDTKIVRGQKMVRRQRHAYERGIFIGYCVRNGRPQYEWVREGEENER